MISIIVCSRRDGISVELKQNIAETIGCEYELVIVDNSKNQFNIFQAYNEGVRRSKGDALCFMHEDVIFHSKMWGLAVSKLLIDEPSVGLLGVVGGQFIPQTPSSYWEGGTRIGKMLQGYIINGVYKTSLEGPEVLTPANVVAVDGFWMCIRKELFDFIQWDIITYSGFHCYDLDICMQIWQNGYKVQVIPNVLIEHRSPGNTDSSYLEQNRLFFEKWKQYLPICKGIELSEREVAQRTKMVRYMRGYLHVVCKQEKELENIRKSKAYRLGKAILKPFKWLRKK